VVFRGNFIGVNIFMDSIIEKIRRELQENSDEHTGSQGRDFLKKA
jgi:hypothetical protein